MAVLFFTCAMLKLKLHSGLWLLSILDRGVGGVDRSHSPAYGPVRT